MFTHTKLIFAIILFGFMVGCSTAEPTVISEATIPTEIVLHPNDCHQQHLQRQKNLPLKQLFLPQIFQLQQPPGRK